MSRYTLKTFFGTEQVERYEHRSKARLQGILSHPRYYKAGETGPFGEIEKNPDRFEIFNSIMEKIHNGTINETNTFLSTLK